MPKAAVWPAPLAAHAMAPDVGQMEGDATEGSSKVMVLGERLASTVLTPSVARGGVAMGPLWREGSAVLGVGGESSSPDVGGQ